GRCCKELRKHAAKLIVPLTELDENKNAVVAYLHTHDQEALQKLIAMGVLPQTELTLLQKFPTILFQLGKSQFAVDKELAAHVYVRKL
ncbi:MAG: ferrous iron transport protein A, partial [Lentisphaerae bacterium]|nr:ferrous iron transport protein A [Lentisphaerota bacterium]